jgi:hypothetical protein
VGKEDGAGGGGGGGGGGGDGSDRWASEIQNQRPHRLSPHGIDLVVVLHACAQCYMNHVQKRSREHALSSSGVASARTMLPLNMHLRGAADAGTPQLINIYVVEPDDKEFVCTVAKCTKNNT